MQSTISNVKNLTINTKQQCITGNMQSGVRPTSASRPGVSFVETGLQQASQSLEVVKPRTPGYPTLTAYLHSLCTACCMALYSVLSQPHLYCFCGVVAVLNMSLALLSTHKFALLPTTSCMALHI